MKTEPGIVLQNARAALTCLAAPSTDSVDYLRDTLRELLHLPDRSVSRDQISTFTEALAAAEAFRTAVARAREAFIPR